MQAAALVLVWRTASRPALVIQAASRGSLSSTVPIESSSVSRRAAGTRSLGVASMCRHPALSVSRGSMSASVPASLAAFSPAAFSSAPALTAHFRAFATGNSNSSSPAVPAAAGGSPSPFLQKKEIMTLTPSATERVAELMELDAECQGIKISLRQRGCSGMSYVMDFLKTPANKFDEVITFNDSKGVEGKVVVDSKAVLFLVGTEMDYKEVEMGSEFVFKNPNQKGACGCGQSFNV